LLNRGRSRDPAIVAVMVLVAAALFGVYRAAKPPAAPAPTLPPSNAPTLPLLKPSDNAPSLIPPGCEQVTIKRAVDGDTAELSDGRRVRYLGIDTPEHNQSFFEEAKRLNAQMVEGKTAWLEFDAEKTDRYGRLLAFVWTKDGGERMVSAEMLRAGLARVYTPGPNARHKDALLACQREARENKRGSWANYVFEEGSWVTTRSGHAFHKPGCDALREANASTLKTWTSRDQVMDAGFSPCRTCKP